MIKTILALTFLFNSYALMAESRAVVKSEVELKVALTKSGYEALKKVIITKYNGVESERNDTYFDIFSDSRYVLRDLALPVKLRFMWDGENLKWQNQKVIKTGSRSIFSIKTTEATDIEMKYDNVLFANIQNYFSKLELRDASVLTVAEKIQTALINKSLIDNSEDSYFPTHSNHKKRSKIKLKIEGDEFSIQVGETNNRGIISYEMEAEIKKSSDINLSADRLNKWLQSQGFKANHIDISVPVDPTLWSEQLLDELFVFGVQNF